jgi:hypothetical protein
MVKMKRATESKGVWPYVFSKERLLRGSVLICSLHLSGLLSTQVRPAIIISTLHRWANRKANWSQHCAYVGPVELKVNTTAVFAALA